MAFFELHSAAQQKLSDALAALERNDAGAALLLLELATVTVEQATTDADKASLASLEQRRGDALVRLGRWQEAGIAYANAVDALGSREQAEDLLLVEPSRKLSDTLVREGHGAEAVELLKELLAGLEQGLGPTHVTVAVLRCDLASAQWAKGEPKAALKSYQAALTVLEKVPDAEGEALSHALIQLACLGLYEGLGTADEAQRYLHRALPLVEKAFGPTHPEVGQVLRHLAMAHQATGDHERAVTMAQAALALEEKGGKASLRALSAASILGNALVEAGRVDEAVPLLERVERGLMAAGADAEALEAVRARLKQARAR